MTIGLVGRKSGMTRIFTEDGASIPVSVVEVEPNRITQVKTIETDGYDAVQVTSGTRRASRVNKTAAGHFAKAETGAGRGLWELRLEQADEELKIGGEITVDTFEAGQKIDVTGQSKGKGFQGVVKRHGFAGVGQATHGQHNRLRAPGSIGAASYPARVFKGMRMAGRMGNEKVTVQNLKVLKVVSDKNLLVLKGCVPGHKNSYVIIRK